MCPFQVYVCDCAAHALANLFCFHECGCICACALLFICACMLVCECICALVQVHACICVHVKCMHAQLHAQFSACMVGSNDKSSKFPNPCLGMCNQKSLSQAFQTCFSFVYIYPTRQDIHHQSSFFLANQNCVFLQSPTPKQWP